ncbi:SIMPL domain-containing protein [Pseudovibrio flavus]|uniref:SIMPL domain-containing protein n=1 Tax=Pseudovibrio flavus TaxID=2529854 RepID=UPI00211C9F59|nr:SIMPL domain-containing protein [Pseudovibrio flavus]
MTVGLNTLTKAGAALAVAGTLTLAGPALADETSKITVTGTGVVTVTPDKALVTSRVVTQNKDAKAALEENSKKVSAMIEMINDAGIEKENIQTSGFDISPVYNNLRSADQNATPEIVAYRVSNGVEISVSEIGKLGSLLPSMVSEGANSIGNIQFVVSDENAKLDQAREAAVADAIRKAKLYATALGGQLGNVISMQEGGSYSPRPEPYMMRAAMDSTTPIAAGQENLTANVTVTFELSQ